MPIPCPSSLSTESAWRSSHTSFLHCLHRDECWCFGLPHLHTSDKYGLEHLPQKPVTSKSASYLPHAGQIPSSSNRTSVAPLYYNKPHILAVLGQGYQPLLWNALCPASSCAHIGQ